MDPNPAKKLPPSKEPNVQVVVGGETFLEHEHTLRSWSEYFDAAFRSGMKESQLRRFEFPDDKADEWRLIMSLIDPSNPDFLKFTIENAPLGLAWFDRLGISVGMEKCEEFLCKDQSDWNYSYLKREQAEIDSVLRALEYSQKYDLKALKKTSFSWYEKYFDNDVHQDNNVYCWGRENLNRLIVILKDYDEFREHLWPNVKPYIPDDLLSEDPQTYLGNPIFPQLMWTSVRLKTANGILAPRGYSTY